jgi:hypothetical protein
MALALTYGSALAQPKLALVVGNSNYESSPLSSPGHDVDAIEKILTRLNFVVARKKNLNQNAFREELRDFSVRLKKSPGAIAFFYYSGHGMQVNGNNYLVPIGAKIESEADVSIYGVRVDEVILRMRSGNTSTSILVLDACRNNPYEKRFKSPDAGLARSAAPPGTLIAFAAAPGAVAAQASGGALSPYTAALVGSLTEPTPLLLTLQKVANKVHTESGGRQSPYIETSAGFDATVALNASTSAAMAPSSPPPKRDEGVNPGAQGKRPQVPRAETVQEYIALIRASSEAKQKAELKISARRLLVQDFDFGTVEQTKDGVFRSFKFVSYDPESNKLVVDQKYESRRQGVCSPTCPEYVGRLTVDLSRVDRVQSFSGGAFDLDCWYSAQYRRNKCIVHNTVKNSCQYEGCDSGSDQSIPFHIENNSRLSKFRNALQTVIYKIDGRPAI